MNQSINVLYIGYNDLLQDQHLENLQVHQCHDIKDITGEYQVVIIDMILSSNELHCIMSYIPTHGCFITENVVEYYGLESFVYRKQAKVIKECDIAFLKTLPFRFYVGHKAEKLPLQHIGVNRSFRGTVAFEGRQYILLKGDFGNRWKQTCFWKDGIEADSKMPLSLWLEYIKDDDVHIQLYIEEIKKETLGEICYEKIIDEDMMKEPFVLDELPCNGIINFSLRVTGKGLLKIGSLHIRQSRYEEGFYLPGDSRFYDYKRQELFAYFDPGDMKPPLNVFFSDYHLQEGFEGYEMMKTMNSPFILFSDPRLDGGSFYIGSEEYESQLRKFIQNKMNVLHFNEKDLIFTGLSMGSYAALYYGCDFSPNSIIIGQPLTNLGSVAKNETIFRPEVFPTSLDVLRQNGLCELSDVAVEELNNRFWKKFDRSKLEGTKIVSSYMKNDDYDKDAFSCLTTHSINKNNTIYGKGIEGRHNDNKDAIVNWYHLQYERILKEDFDRGE